MQRNVIRYRKPTNFSPRPWRLFAAQPNQTDGGWGSCTQGLSTIVSRPWKAEDATPYQSSRRRAADMLVCSTQNTTSIASESRRRAPKNGTARGHLQSDTANRLVLRNGCCAEGKRQGEDLCWSYPFEQGGQARNTSDVISWWKLGKASMFSKLDANSGFWQLSLDEESKLLTTFITPQGRFAFNRIPFGISSAPEIFTRTISVILQGLDYVTWMISWCSHQMKPNMMTDWGRFCNDSKGQDWHLTRSVSLARSLYASWVTSLTEQEFMLMNRSWKPSKHSQHQPTPQNWGGSQEWSING